MVSSIALRVGKKTRRLNSGNKKFHDMGLPPDKIRGASEKKIIEHYTGFAKLYAAKYLRSHPGSKLSYEDACEETYCGLLKAKTMFDPGKEVEFTTYAAQWMKAYLDRAVKNSKYPVHVPYKKMKTMIAERFAYEAYAGIIHPSMLNTQSARIFHEIVKDDARLEEARLNSMLVTSTGMLMHFEKPIDNSESSPRLFSDIVAGDETADASEKIRLEKLSRVVRNYLGNLDRRERLIAKERLMADEPRTLQDLGEELGISRERVRQLESRLKKKLREKMENDPVISEEIIS